MNIIMIQIYILGALLAIVMTLLGMWVTRDIKRGGGDKEQK